jgi:hypothetical protein
MTKSFLYICLGTRTFRTRKRALHRSKTLQRCAKSTHTRVCEVSQRHHIPNKDGYMPIAITVRNFASFQRCNLSGDWQKRCERCFQVSSREWNLCILERGLPPHSHSPSLSSRRSHVRCPYEEGDCVEDEGMVRHRPSTGGHQATVDGNCASSTVCRQSPECRIRSRMSRV